MAFFMGSNWLLARWFTPTIAFLIAYVPAVTLHFTLNKWWTFGCERTDTIRQISQYLFAVAVTFVVQLVFFWCAHELLHVPGWLAAGIANAGQMILSFCLLQWHVFAARRSLS